MNEQYYKKIHRFNGYRTLLKTISLTDKTRRVGAILMVTAITLVYRRSKAWP